jgi:hypothetical protein
MGCFGMAWAETGAIATPMPRHPPKIVANNLRMKKNTPVDFYHTLHDVNAFH